MQVFFQQFGILLLTRVCYYPDSGAGIQKLRQPCAKMSRRESYAMGWVVGKIGEEKVVWHNGGVPNFYSYMAVLPDSKYGMVLLVNALNMFKLNQLDNIARCIVRLLLRGEICTLHLMLLNNNSLWQPGRVESL